MNHSVLTERRGSVALITLNNPAKLNALDPDGLALLLNVVEKSVADPRVAALVLTGGERAFCSGEDLDAAATISTEEFAVQAGMFQALARSIIQTNKPTVAAVAGPAFGGGLEIALNCDVRIAAPNARFACPEAKWGMTVSNGASLLLRRCIGDAWTRELMIFGRELDAESALRVGLVTRVSAEGGVVDAAVELAEHAVQSASGIAYAKALLREASQGVLEALDAEQKALVESFDTAQTRERLAGFAAGKRRGGAR